MTEQIQNSLRESKTARWIALLFVSLTLVAGYYFADVMSPLKSMLTENAKYAWDGNEYGFFTGAYSWLVVLGFLILGGIMLDKSGIRFTGIMFSIIMIIGAFLNYYALSDTFLNGGFGFDFLSSFMKDYNPSVKLAAAGYAIFGLGIEILGVTGSRIVVKWFKGKEMAFAMALQVAFGRLGMLWVFWQAPRLAGEGEIVTRPIALGLVILVIGFLTYLVYSVMDFKLDKQEVIDLSDEKEEFKFSDLGKILTNKAFWYIAMLCVLFYSAVFPFMKYAPDLMVNKFLVLKKTAGDIPSLLPLGTMLLTPVVGLFLDFKGKSASIMIFGSLLLILVHLGFAFGPANQWFAIGLMMILGVSFSFVPGAMWPSVPSIVKEQYLGTAYSLIFWIQNWGLMGFPMLIGWALEKYNPGITEQLQGGADVHYDYTVPMIIFAATGFLGLLFAFLLKVEDKKKGYGLELPNKIPVN
ncbi:MAG: MFS transporter [Bacteroidales bacterium]|nr:MFS transporter [Bacteroidales bacterium]MBN2755638.1 MFS transporter [Bacteroidales bacterium]